MNIGAAETYTHLLIPIEKTRCPTAEAVCAFLERIIQSGTIGQDYKIGFRKIVKVGQPVSREVLNPFTRKRVRHRLPSRHRYRGTTFRRLLK